MTEFDGDLRRSREAYAARDRKGSYSALYDPLVPGALFRLQERDWTFADIFRGAGIRILSGLDLLEVGCGGGASLGRFVGLRAKPDRLAGIDLVTERIEAARRLRLPACCSHYAAIIRPLPVRPVPATRASS